MKIMTFNLKTDNMFTISNPWKKRRIAAYEILNDYDCDIVGTQEVSNIIYNDIINELKEYWIKGKARSRHFFSERNSLIVKQHHKIESEETFWLSNSPQKEGSSFWYSLFPRICTTAKIHLKDGSKIRVFNTHLDCLSNKARKNGIIKIMEQIESFYNKEKLPTVLMGDFNANPNSGLIKSINSGEINRRGLVAVEEFNPNLYKDSTFRLSGNKNLHIDYIFVSKEFKVKNVEIIKKSKLGIYPSDHYPMIAELEL